MSLPSWVRVGAKCVCVDARFVNLTEGARYTIAAIVSYETSRPFKAGPYAGTSHAIVLSEVVGNPLSDTNGFAAERFRPLIDETDEAKERDAEMFREWLNVHGALPVRERALLVEASEGGSGV